MSSEKINQNQEKEHGASERLKDAGFERQAELENLREQLEKSAEQSPEKNIDKARHEVEKATAEELEKRAPEQERQPSPAERRTSSPNKAELDSSFNTTMTEAQAHMSAPSRAFSKVIHNKAVEKVSEAAGSTIARPDAILSGAIFAFILTLAVYLVAKNFGYPLSGFETIGAFALGWVLGLTYDFLKVMITGRK